jgi:hypothetical protein
MPKAKSEWIFYALLLALLGYASAKITHNGDFVGYVNVGNHVINGTDIYDDIFNTWPPVFSILSVPLAMLDSISFVGVRIIWLLVLFVCLFYCFKIFIQIQQNTSANFKSILIHLKSPQYIIVLLLIMRPFMDNLMYLQINPVMLLVCVFALFYFNKNSKLSATALGFSIGSKVYNLFLIPVYIIFKEWRQLLFVLLGIALTYLLCVLVFGFDLSYTYHKHWLTQIASSIQTIEHRNQSLFGALLRLFSQDNLIINEFPYLYHLNPKTVQKIYYLLVLTAAIYFLFNYFKQIKKGDFAFKQVTLILVLGIIPLLTPLAWKANYIYALPVHFYLVNAWYKNELNKMTKILYVIACVLLNLSNEALIGSEGMYFLEKCNVLVIGQILLIICLFRQMNLLKKQMPENDVASSGI